MRTTVRGKVSTVGLAAPEDKTGGTGGATGALGRDAGVPARPDAKSAADLAARRPAGAGRFGDVDGLGNG